MGRLALRLPPPAAVLGAVLAVLTAACSAGGIPSVEPLPDPPPTQATTTTVAPPDLSGVQLPSVPGRVTTTTIVMGPGDVTLGGTVQSPAGPAPGAVVLVERFVGDATVTAQVAAGDDGAWTMPGVQGGQYRIRAWRSPDLAQIEPALIFLAARDAAPAPLELRLERFAGPFPSPSVAPNPPVVEEQTTLVVQVSLRSVDEGGIVRAVPMVGARVELAAGGFWQVLSSNPTAGDSGGRAHWELRCRAAGRQALTLLVNGIDSFPLTLPACTEPAPVLAPLPPGTPTTASTPTSRPPKAPATTTTTRSPATTTTSRRPGQ